MSFGNLESFWDALPAPCVQAIAQQLSAKDRLSARLACSSWSRLISLPQISLTLSVTPTGLSCHSIQSLRDLLLAQQDCRGALGLVSQLSLKLAPYSSAPSQPHLLPQPAAAAAAEAAAAEAEADGCLQQQQEAQHPDGWNVLLADVLAALPSLSSLSVSILKPQHQDSTLQMLQRLPSSSSSSSSGQSPAGTLQDCHAVLLQLLSLQQLQQQISSFTMACEGLWPAHEQLATALEQLQKLSSLQLLNCPVSALARLPSLPQLRQLAVTGRYFEPVPRSYSVRQQPLLPLLPGLQQLSLWQLPHDVQSQEQEDVFGCQMQQRGAAAAAADRQRQQDIRRVQGVTEWRTVQQWVGRSIQQQCPNLQQLKSDVILGGPVLQLLQLQVVQMPHSHLAAATASSKSYSGSASVSAAATAAKAGPKAAGSTSSISGSRHTGSSSRGIKGCAGAAAAGQDVWCCCQQQVLCSCCS